MGKYSNYLPSTTFARFNALEGKRKKILKYFVWFLLTRKENSTWINGLKCNSSICTSIFINIQWDFHDRLYKHFKGCDTRNTKRKLTNRKGLWRRRRRIILNLIRTSAEVRICLINICREISWQLLWDLLTHSLFVLNRGNCLHRKMRALVEEREREA